MNNFLIDGKLVTNLVREKLYYDNNLIGAIKLVTDFLETSDLSEGDKLSIALDILNGSKEITNSEDGSLVISECQKESLNSVENWYENFLTTFNAIKKENTELIEKLTCVSENIGYSDKKTIERAWKNDYDGEDSIFEDNSELDEINLALKSFGIDSSDPLNDYLERDPRDDDYGWLSPQGDFYETDWSKHQEFAYQWLKEHRTDFGFDSSNAGDALIERGWVLLHNPSQGIAFITKSDLHNLTKKQKDFLYDYYVSRELFDKAEEVLEKY